MSFRLLSHQLLEEAGPGQMLSTAYDTAWIARLVELDEPIGQQAMEWLREHQLPDGSWGAPAPHYYHDRLISTLAAMIALGKWGDHKDQIRLQRAKLALDISVKGLRADPVGETVGFEMIAPTLLSEVNQLGIIERSGHEPLQPKMAGELSLAQNITPAQNGDGVLDHLGIKRAKKLQALARNKINRMVTIAFSAEMVGTDGLDLLDVDHLQEANGSVGHSPSATAHFVLHVRPKDPAGLAYLRQTVAQNDLHRGAPDVAPFDNFERAWTLWNLSLPVSGLDKKSLALCQPHLDFLEKAWKPGYGVGFAAEYTPKDGDDSGLIFDVLARYGRQMDIETLLSYEKEDHFRCYQLESDPSISANIHMLGALFQAGFDTGHTAVKKVIDFLRRSRNLDMFWFDKWHVSPYYPTTHVVISAEGHDTGLEASAIHWILSTQNKDGSWGYYGPSAEETAYCLQALFIWKRSGHLVPEDVLKRGLGWLEGNMDPPYMPLWIGKCLYSPTLVIRSAILSALMLGAEE